MAGVILVALDHPAAAATLLRAALRAAGMSMATRINALLVRALPEAMVSPSEEVLTASREAELRDAEAQRAQAIRDVFDTWAAALPSGLTAEWIDTDGIPEMVVEDRGRRADCIVIERPTPHDYGTSWQALRAALFASDRPVLVVPRDCSAEFGRRVAIAWRDDERATKAVLAALRCLQACEQVLVLTGTREGSPEPKLPEILQEHGVAAELHVLPIGDGPFGAALLNEAQKLGADMLVMGAYQHNPLRELLLGGVTRYMLGHANLPVLLRH